MDGTQVYYNIYFSDLVNNIRYFNSIYMKIIRNLFSIIIEITSIYMNIIYMLMLCCLFLIYLNIGNRTRIKT